MYEHAAEYGIVYHSGPPYEVLRTRWLDFSEMIKLRQLEEMLEVYYNSGQYEVTMKILETQYESAFAMYQQLGEFYEERGYFSMSHSRLRRSEILLEFAEGAAPQALPVLKESLIYDLYARENLKSRPAWAADMAEWKEMTRRYCKNKKQSHVERFSYRFPAGEVRTIAKLPEREKEMQYVLFDYAKRDPLNRQAFSQYIKKESGGTDCQRIM